MVTSSKDFFTKCIDCKNFIKYLENNKEYDDLGKFLCYFLWKIRSIFFRISIKT
jgi:hypothetical protein